MKRTVPQLVAQARRLSEFGVIELTVTGSCCVASARYSIGRRKNMYIGRGARTIEDAVKRLIPVLRDMRKEIA